MSQENLVKFAAENHADPRIRIRQFQADAADLDPLDHLDMGPRSTCRLSPLEQTHGGVELQHNRSEKCFDARDHRGGEIFDR